MPTVRFTNDYATACRLRDEGFEPIECAFGQYGSVLGPLEMDHHGTESHREGVALRACRDLYGARADDPRFVVTGTPDADATLAIVALAALVPRDHLEPSFYELVDRHDTDPIGLDLLGAEEGLMLAWFNQHEGLTQSEKGFRAAIEVMTDLLNLGLDDQQRDQVRRADDNRRRTAVKGILGLYDADARPVSVPEDARDRPVRRGAHIDADAGRVLVVQSVVWGFDQWYRLAPLVVSFATRMAKVTVGCPDRPTADALFGEGGLMNVWPELGRGWGGRETIGGSPRGTRLAVHDAHATAERLLALMRARG